MNEYDYIIDAFTRDGNNTNLEVDNLTVGCIESKNNNFSLDSNGNLTVNSITTSGGGIDFDRIYPVGAIYLSVVNTNPGTLFGGTWEQIKDVFLLSAGDTYIGGSTGGEATHQLTTSEMPQHRHRIGYRHGARLSTSGTYYTVGGSEEDGGGGYGYSNYTGSGDSHNNMPPYVTVYMWKRTL